MSLRERTRPGLGIIEPCLPSRAKVQEKGRLIVSLKVHECRMSAIECEKRASRTDDPALKQSYASLAKEWRDVATQVESLESQMEALKAHKNSK
jgi:hypothetical protein